MGAVAAARVALSLIRGDGPQPLPGEWAQLRQAELERLISRARLVAATALLEAGDWMAAADAAAAAPERDPYDEAALRVLLRAYVMGGRVAAALAAYASARERMADELGTDPSPETTALYTAILRGELTVPDRPSPAARGLVGRDDELAYLDAIAARARGGSVEVVVVDGEAGIGKTTLLRAWADRRAAAGDTVLMASCGPLDRSLPLDALLTALAALLRELGPEVTADILGADAAMLAPLLNMAPGPRPPPVLADSMLGPAVLYSALVRVLRPPGGARAAGGRDRRRAPGRPRAAGLAAFRPARGRGGDGRRRGPVRRGRAAARDGVHPPGRARPGRGGRAGRAGPGRRAVRPVEGAPAVPDRAGPAGRGRGTARVAGRVGVRAVRRARPGRAAAAHRGRDRPGTGRRPARGGARPSRHRAARRRRAGRGQAVPGRRGRDLPVPARTGQGGAGGERDRGPGRAAAPAGRPGARPAARRRPADGGRPRAPGRRPRAGRPGAAGRVGAGRGALRPRGGRGAARRCAAAVPRPGRLAGAGPGPHPAQALRRGPGGRRAGRGPPGRPRWRSAPGRPISAASSRRPSSSPRTARSPRPTRPPGPGAWRSAAGPGTPPATWPGPNCCSARRSRSPRARTGSPRPGGWGCSGPIRAGWTRRWRCCARRPAGSWGWSIPRPPCTPCCSPGTRTRWRAARRRRWPRSPGTPPRWNGARSPASPAAR